MRSVPVYWQGDLRKVYVDPHRPPKGHDMLAYIPEQHATPACERALPAGREATPDWRGLWCETCTTPHKNQATIRRALTGGWKLVA